MDATLPYVVADDFPCTNASTITNIQIWSSFLGNQADPNLTFVLAIWSDALPPAAAVPGFSRPGSLLWTETFAPGQYTSSIYGSGDERFYVPATGQLGDDTTVYLYSFTPVRPFCQQGSANNPKVYWLSVYAKPSTAGTSLQYGWKTSTNHFRDDAVWGTVVGSGYAGNWKELFSPVGTPQVSLDMAFQLINGPPSPDCDPSVRPKWVELPDTSTNGLDVLATAPNIVGDDFLCRTRGPISGITIWGSWLNDLVDTERHLRPAPLVRRASQPRHHQQIQPSRETCSAPQPSRRRKRSAPPWSATTTAWWQPTCRRPSTSPIWPAPAASSATTRRFGGMTSIPSSRAAGCRTALRFGRP